ncbi:restriction endonuclease subunit S [Rhizobium sp. AAP116]|uniref:restriction endonuclease subunit S n=1 Tax=Rhizobium sp. AAP116 TaxID=1523429 RepID=UPI0006B8CF3D|nr:restriction endonuclease subunit S [Rhizobium sp. AAP116]
MLGDTKRLRGLIIERSQRLREGEVLPVVSVTNHNGIQLASETFSRQVYSRELINYKIIKPGWYAFNPSRVNVGSLARNDLGYDVCASPMYTVFECISPELDADYLNAFLTSSRFTERVAANLQGSVRDALSFDALQTFPIHLPPIYEQRAVAEVLSKVEGTITKTESLITALIDAKHATMREILTRGIRREKAQMKPLPARWVLGRVAEGVTHIPSDWELVTLTKVAKLESGHTPDRKEPTYWDGNIPWISLQDANALTKVTISESAETIGPLGLANSSARMLPSGTVVLQRTANVGLASVMGREMCTSQHFANWICGNKLDPYYLQQVFRHMSREWGRLVAGSVLPDIYMGTFKALQILLPPLEEQKIIGEVGVAFDLRIEEERGTLAALKDNRAALAQELLSGRISLPDSVIARHRDKAEQAA